MLGLMLIFDSLLGNLMVRTVRLRACLLNLLYFNR